MRVGVNTEIGVVQALLYYVLGNFSKVQPLKNLVSLVRANFDRVDPLKRGLRILTKEGQNPAQSCIDKKQIKLDRSRTHDVSNSKKHNGRKQ